MHEKYMELAIAEALMGAGKTFTNPLVGAVIVKNKQIISKGYHMNFGENHAEVNAILSCLSPKELINSTLYVTLEPCCHMGKQPPCTDLIINSGIKKIYIGQLDPNPLVSGMGVNKLTDNGIEVRTGILEKKVRHINEHYNTFFEKKRPFVTLKQSVSLDGKISLFQKRTAITSEATNNFIKKERAKFQAILVGSQTILTDNPILKASLNHQFQPTRVVLDRRGRLFETDKLKIFLDNESSVIIFTEKTEIGETPNHVEVINSEKITITFVLQELAKRQIQSVYVEGGANIHDAFLESDKWDELISYIAPKLIGGDGISGFSSQRESKKLINLENMKIKQLNEDLRVSIRRLSTCLQD